MTFLIVYINNYDALRHLSKKVWLDSPNLKIYMFFKEWTVGFSGTAAQKSLLRSSRHPQEIEIICEQMFSHHLSPSRIVCQLQHVHI